MLIFFFNSGQGGSWSVGPLIALVPFLIQIAPYFLQGLDFSGSRRQLANGDVLWLLVLAALCATASLYFVRWVSRNGGWSFLVQLLLQGYQNAPAGNGHAPQGPGGRGRPQQHGRPRVGLEEITDALLKLPTESYMTADQLKALTVHELKDLIRARGLEPVKCLEKGELVRQLLEHGGSSAHSCSICCEDYTAAGPKPSSGSDGRDADTAGGEAADGRERTTSDADVLRVLRCGHRFHVECVDKWFLSATDYTRAPACPLCNSPLLEPKDGTASTH